MIHTSAMFTWNPQTRTLSTEASTLGRGGNFMEPIKNWCGDHGFTIISEHTGEEVTFYLSRTETDRENDVRAWYFAPATKQDGKKVREGTTVVVFNT
jgi:hypothetical protein